MNKPIGVFDSGVGGLTVANAIKKALPNEQLIYFGDTAHLPYGDKSPKAIAHYLEAILGFFKEKECKAVVVACNSASTIIQDLPNELKNWDGLINVIDPVVEEATNSNLNKMALIGTKRTVDSNAYSKKISNINPQLLLQSLPTPLLVPIIEEGLGDSEICNSALNHYFSKLQDFDGLILGCTHYPIITDAIKGCLSHETTIFEAPRCVSNALFRYLSQNDSLAQQRFSNDQFYVTDLTPNFVRTSQLFFGSSVQLTELDYWN